MQVEVSNSEQVFTVEVSFSYEKKGYGQYSIICVVLFNKKEQRLSSHCTDSEFIDKIDAMVADDASYQDIQEVYYKKFFLEEFQERVLQFCEENA